MNTTPSSHVRLTESICLSGPFVLAPLAGYTDIPMRKICRDHGASLVFTELISAEGIVRKNPKTIKLLEISEKERPVGIQLFGNDPEKLRDAAVIADELFHPDCIDINSGCSVQKVVGSNSGAALLKDPDKLHRIVSLIKESVKTPVSVKIRIGWDNDSRNYLQVVQALIDAGVSFISVHGRTRAQKYTGKADWDIIGEISAISRVPIIGNGDIDSFETAQSKLHNYGCTAVMIGRAAIGNPWIFSGHTTSLDERINCAANHLRAMVEYYGEYGTILARKHLVRYFHGFTNAAHLRGKIVEAKTSSDVLQTLESFRGDTKIVMGNTVPMTDIYE